MKELKIDRAIYLVDKKTKTYRFLRRNPDWRVLSKSENKKNKKSISGFTRIFKDGRKKRFKFNS